MTKTDLRITYKAFRQLLSEDEIEAKSLAIANGVLQLPIWEKTYFHIFLPILEQKEVDTEYLLHLLSGKDKEIVVSKSNFDTRKMTHYLLTDNTKIRKNDYGIPEPVDGLEVPSLKIEVVFVPLLAFDKSGHRVGYGKGFYDKFLSECQPNVVKIGVSFYEAEEKIDGLISEDIQLDYCVTPTTTYRF